VVIAAILVSAVDRVSGGRWRPDHSRDRHFTVITRTVDFLSTSLDPW